MVWNGAIAFVMLLELISSSTVGRAGFAIPRCPYGIIIHFVMVVYLPFGGCAVNPSVQYPRPVTCPPASTQSKPCLPTPALLLNLSRLACSIRLATSEVGNPDIMVAFWRKRV